MDEVEGLADGEGVLGALAEVGTLVFEEGAVLGGGLRLNGLRLELTPETRSK